MGQRASNHPLLNISFKSPMADGSNKWTQKSPSVRMMPDSAPQKSWQQFTVLKSKRIYLPGHPASSPSRFRRSAFSCLGRSVPEWRGGDVKSVSVIQSKHRAAWPYASDVTGAGWGGMDETTVAPLATSASLFDPVFLFPLLFTKCSEGSKHRRATSI